MATITNEIESTEKVAAPDAASFLWKILTGLGSLKLTVALFACSLIIVLVGTLAQDEMNMLEVKERYFMSWIAPLHIDDFFPQSFLPHENPIGFVVPFPGGALIGLMLMVNLLAAKSTRFHVHAKGARLFAGILFLIAGAGVAALVIMAGHSSDGLQGTPPIEYTTLWAFVLAGVTVLGIGLGVGATRMPNTTIRNMGLFVAALIGCFVVFALVTGFRIGDPGLRIVWQLGKGLGAGLILLVGCKLIFDRQGGNMLLHMGVALMMVGQFAFGDRQTEQRLNLVEGQSTNTFVNMDAVEMTFVETDDEKENVTAIPGSLLRKSAQNKTLISDASLPFDVRVLEFYENSGLGPVDSTNLATKGLGLRGQAIAKAKAGGTESEINVASAYVELLSKQSGESQGTYLISQQLSDASSFSFESKEKDLFDAIDAGDKSYKFGLKFHREVKPYWVQLDDVRQINYSGTSTPRDYSSFIRIIESDTGKERKERVWMNNPLRFRGETFYQSNYRSLPNGKEWTSIQVVRNSGWLIPYVACSITGIGLLAHFLGTLIRFLRRRERETRVERAELSQRTPSRIPIIATVTAFAAIALVALIPWSAVKNQMRPESRMTSFDWYTAGKIPTQFGGRMMPLDAYAQQTLKAISNRSSLSLDSVPSAIKDRVDGRRLSAMQWLMEVAIDEPALQYLPMIRVDAGEVRNELGIERRESKLYSLDEIRAQAESADRVVADARGKEPRDRTFKERKMLELSGRTIQYQFASESFRLPALPEISEAEFKEMLPEEDPANIPLFAIRMLQRRMEMIKNAETPAIVAPTQAKAEDEANHPRWLPFAPAFVDHANEVILSKLPDSKPRPGVQTFGDMIKAYGDNDTEAFNLAVDKHLESVGQYPIPGYNPDLIGLERWMQSNWPTGVALFLYMACVLMCLFYLIVNLPRLRSAAWGVLAVAFAIHTIAIVCRISITGRAPVINLYSASVFIGWAAVLFGLVIERLFRYGAGNLLAAVAGVMSLMLAYGLNTGDTMPVLEAVLDTQFWLATHVVTVTLGYAATLAAGTVGIGYLVAGWFGADKKTRHNVFRFCYGATCFGIVFSFIGTVLGGLWADDSWGRFWGWDPKENGALLIVIWNALMLHARWDGMVGPRGFASLAIGGNIVTAWSFFGTNELGIGLHSYGFTEGVLMWLSLYVASQMLFIVLDGVVRMTGLRFGSAS
jgi:ABC-type transport system involved in cytochrome c biogenesis permease subunit